MDRWHFHIHFLEAKFLYWTQNFIAISSQVSDWQLVRIGWGNGLVPNRQQAITGTNDNLVYLCKYASPGTNKLMENRYMYNVFVLLLYLFHSNLVVTKPWWVGANRDISTSLIYWRYISFVVSPWYATTGLLLMTTHKHVKETYLSNIARNTSFVVAKARKVARNTLTYVESISPVSVLRACTSRYNVPALIILISNVRHCKWETLSSSRSVPCLGNFNGMIIKILS